MHEARTLCGRARAHLSARGVRERLRTSLGHPIGARLVAEVGARIRTVGRSTGDAPRRAAHAAARARESARTAGAIATIDRVAGGAPGAALAAAHARGSVGAAVAVIAIDSVRAHARVSAQARVVVAIQRPVAARVRATGRRCRRVAGAAASARRADPRGSIGAARGCRRSGVRSRRPCLLRRCARLRHGGHGGADAEAPVPAIRAPVRAAAEQARPGRHSHQRQDRELSIPPHLRAILSGEKIAPFEWVPGSGPPGNGRPGYLDCPHTARRTICPLGARVWPAAAIVLLGCPVLL